MLDVISFIVYDIFHLNNYSLFFYSFLTDDMTRDISIALYRYLCLNIVGREDYVKQSRMMTTVRDNLTCNGDMTVVTSGSFGEGLDMRGSDLDMMYVFKKVEVYGDIKPFFNQNVTYFSMDRDAVNPGFTQLQLRV